MSTLNTAVVGRRRLGLGASATMDVGTTAGTVAAGDDPRFSGTKPWVFDTVAHGGAVGDGLWVGDAAITSGSKHVTSASGMFRPSDVTKVFLFHKMTAAGDVESGTIDTYVSATEVVLSVAAGSTVSAGSFFWGTDDTQAFKTSTFDAIDYAAIHGDCDVYTPLPPNGRYYMVDGPLDTSWDGNAVIPLKPAADTGATVTVNWLMEGASAAPESFNSLSPAFNGATIVSTGHFASKTAQGNSINNGNPCVIGGPSQANGYAQSEKFSNMVVNFSGTILTAHSVAGLTYCGVDFSSVKARVHDTYIGTTGAVARNEYQNFAAFGGDDGPYAIGLLMGMPGNNDYSVMESVTIGGGFGFGAVFGEHTDIMRLCTLYCSAGVCPVGNYYGSVGSIHSSVASLISVEACTWILRIFGKGSGGVGPTIHMRIDTETSTPRFGDRNGGSDIGSAKGEVLLGGVVTKSGLILDGPPGFDIVDVNGDPTLVNANYTVNFLDRRLVIDATAGNVTATLPTAANFPTGKTFSFKRIDGAAHTATVATAGGQTIDGASTKTLTQWASFTVAAYNGEWLVV